MKRGILAAICLVVGLLLAVALAPSISVPVDVPVTMNAAEAIAPLAPGVAPPATGGGNGQY